MNLRNSNGIESRDFYFTTVQKLFSKIFIRSRKLDHVELNSGTSNQVSKNPSIRLKIFSYESPMQSYIKNRVKLWKRIQFEGQKSVSVVFRGTLTDVHCTLHSVSLQK